MPAPGENSIRGRGLREKLVRASSILLALVGVTSVLVVGGVEYGLTLHDDEALEDRIRETLNTRGEGLVSSHAGVFRSLVRDTALTEMQRTVSDAVQAPDVIYGVFTDAEGRPWVYCSPTNDCRRAQDDASLALQSVEQVLADLNLSKKDLHPDTARTREVTLFGESALEFSHPVTVEDEYAGTLRYGVGPRALEQTLEKARERHRSLLISSLVTILAMIGLALVVGIVLARRTARRITQPLNDLMSASKKLAAGDRTARVEIHSGDEVELLGNSFNKMVEDLEESYSQLEARNAELNREIEERKLAQAERGQLQDHLNQAQKMDAFGQLAGGVAHDFNNILAVVMGNAELIQIMLAEGDLKEVTELNEQVAEAAAQGANLTRQLLTFARREAAHPRVIDVNKTVRDFDKLIRRVLEETVDVVVETTESLPPVLIDPGRLEQVLMNLCVNARDAMPGGGELRITTKQTEFDEETAVTTGVVAPGRYVTIETQDTGTGMSAEVLSRVFEPFFTTKPAGRGTGLGLATVHGIVKDAGGVIDISSTPGKGTVFCIHLPAQVTSSLEEDESQPTPLPHGVGVPILLCEDDESVRAMIVRILKRAGFDVTGVSSGAHALKELERKQYDLLITDAVMPEMDGGQVSQLVQEKYPSLPVLFVSGYTGGVLQRQGVEEDSMYFLRKPFRAQELLQRVDQILAARDRGAAGPSHDANP